jgi:hypothetical protein
VYRDRVKDDRKNHPNHPADYLDRRIHWEGDRYSKPTKPSHNRIGKTPAISYGDRCHTLAIGGLTRLAATLWRPYGRSGIEMQVHEPLDLSIQEAWEQTDS